MQCIFGDQICNYFLDKIADKLMSAKAQKAELTQQKEKHEEQLLAANTSLHKCREQQIKTEEEKQTEIENCQPGCFLPGIF